MTPVARLILVRSVDKRELVNAMVWVTLPALVGPLIGPALGGFITTYISWHWIFLINIPMGLAGIVLATLFIENVRAETPDPLDFLIRQPLDLPPHLLQHHCRWRNDGAAALPFRSPERKAPLAAARRRTRDDVRCRKVARRYGAGAFAVRRRGEPR